MNELVSKDVMLGVEGCEDGVAGRKDVYHCTKSDIRAR